MGKRLKSDVHGTISVSLILRVSEEERKGVNYTYNGQRLSKI